MNSSTQCQPMFKNLSIFLKGANRVFWLDLDQRTTIFFSLFTFLKNDVLLNVKWYKNLPNSILQDMYSLVSRFYFYYESQSYSFKDYIQSLTSTFLKTAQSMASTNSENLDSQYSERKQSADRLLSSLDHKIELGNQGIVAMAAPELPASLKHDASKFIDTIVRKPSILQDYFVLENVRHVKAIKYESLLIKYIKAFKYFNAMELSDETNIKLQGCLYAFTTPGGPVYPTRNVRKEARPVLDFLFPRGALFRTIIRTFFRLFHPYYSTGSLLAWALDYITAIFQNLYRILVTFHRNIVDYCSYYVHKAKQTILHPFYFIKNKII